jgi:hypothetical protein
MIIGKPESLPKYMNTHRIVEYPVDLEVALKMLSLGIRRYLPAPLALKTD